MIELRALSKVYPGPDGGTPALDNATLTLPAGEFIAIVGKSGSGKSTLIDRIAGTARPTRGDVHAGGQAVHQLDGSQLATWRGRHLGLVFQFFQLLPTLTVLENVTLPMDFCGTFAGPQARQ